MQCGPQAQHRSRAVPARCSQAVGLLEEADNARKRPRSLRRLHSRLLSGKPDRAQEARAQEEQGQEA